MKKIFSRLELQCWKKGAIAGFIYGAVGLYFLIYGDWFNLELNILKVITGIITVLTTIPAYGITFELQEAGINETVSYITYSLFATLFGALIGCLSSIARRLIKNTK